METEIWIKRVVAVMCGKNAIIVDSSANIKKAAQGVASSAVNLQQLLYCSIRLEDLICPEQMRRQEQQII